MGKKRTAIRGVFSLGGGLYQVLAWWTDPKTGRSRKIDRVIKARSVQDATRQRAEIRERLSHAGGPVVAREHLDDFAISWLASKRSQWKRSTMVNAASTLDLHLAPLGDYWIDAITEDDVTAWRDSQKGKPATVNSRMRLLKQLLSDACHKHRCANPAAKIRGVRVGMDPKPDYIPDAGEARALLDWLRTAERYRQWYPLVELLALTGLRFGEATALRWSDVDFEGGLIEVKRAHWHGTIDHPKSKAGLRTVMLAPELAATLRAHQSSTGRVGAAYVFLGRRGNLHQTSVLQKPMRAALEACGLKGKRVSAVKAWRRIHNNLLRRETDEVVRQALMGHAGASVGVKHYSQAEHAEMRAAVGCVVLRLLGGSE